MLSRRDYTLKVSMTWEQADGGAAAVMASMEFQVGYILDVLNNAFRVGAGGGYGVVGVGYWYLCFWFCFLVLILVVVMLLVFGAGDLCF